MGTIMDHPCAPPSRRAVIRGHGPEPSVGTGGCRGRLGVRDPGGWRFHRLRRVRLVRVCPPGDPPTPIRLPHRGRAGLAAHFGRVMPVAMTATMALGVANASVSTGLGGPTGWRWAAAGAWIAALTSTVIFNVPVNLATSRWDPAHPPENWKQVRNRWEFFQGLRSWLLLAGFVLASAGFAIG